jgi:hydroxymethylglutaryl-CoA synthase
MSLIISYGYYFPKYQVADSVLFPNGKQGKSAVAYVDEDVLTLAYEATDKCLNNQEIQVDALFFATNTPVFKNRYHSSFLANALNLGDNITALDFTGSPRAGTDALLLANQLIDARVHKNILVVVSEIDYPGIGEEQLSPFGHAGCAFLLGSNEIPGIMTIGEIKYTRSFSASIAETFTYKGNKIAYDPRFSRDAGFKNNIKNTLEILFNSDSQSPISSAAIGSCNAVILNSQFAKLAVGLFIKAGFTQKQILNDNISAHAGYTGANHALLQLIDSLENKNKNILLFDYFNGTNVISIELFSDNSANKLQAGFSFTRSIKTYQDYLKLRKAGNFTSVNYNPVEMFSSEMMNEREKENSLYLNGFKCEACNSVYLIKTARCKNCRGDKFSLQKLQRTGTVYSLTKEHYFPSSFSPITMAVIDLAGGGRITLQLTDDLYPEDKNKIEIGSKVILVWRKMLENGIKPDYFWKAKVL